MMVEPWDIPGIDTEKGISMTGGKGEFYRKVLALFCEDVKARLPLLEVIPEDLSLFITQAHALKGASASIGAEEISSRAALLEEAGKTGDVTFVQKNLGDFVKGLTELVENIRNALEKMKNSEPVTSSLSIAHYLGELSEALKSENIAEIDRLIDELGQLPLDTGTIAALEQISDEVLMAEFERAAEIINSLYNQGAV